MARNILHIELGKDEVDPVKVIEDIVQEFINCKTDANDIPIDSAGFADFLFSKHSAYILTDVKAKIT